MSLHHTTNIFLNLSFYVQGKILTILTKEDIWRNISGVNLGCFVVILDLHNTNTNFLDLILSTKIYRLDQRL